MFVMTVFVEIPYYSYLALRCRAGAVSLSVVMEGNLKRVNPKSVRNQPKVKDSKEDSRQNIKFALFFLYTHVTCTVSPIITHKFPQFCFILTEAQPKPCFRVFDFLFENGRPWEATWEHACRGMEERS